MTLIARYIIYTHSKVSTMLMADQLPYDLCAYAQSERAVGLPKPPPPPTVRCLCKWKYICNIQFSAAQSIIEVQKAKLFCMPAVLGDNSL